MKVDISDLNKNEILKRAKDEGIEHLDENMTKEQIVHWVNVWEECNKKADIDQILNLVEEISENVKRLHKSRMETHFESAISDGKSGLDENEVSKEENDRLIERLAEENGMKPPKEEEELTIPTVPRPDERGREDG